MSLETQIQASFDNYPTLYGNNRLRVLNYLLVTTGAGVQWRKNGALEISDTGKTEPTDRSKIHRDAMELLRTIPPATELREREILSNHEMIWRMSEAYEKDANQWREFEFPKNDNAGIQRYVAALAKRPIFSSLNLDGIIGDTPRTVKKDVLLAIREILFAILSQPINRKYAQGENHTNAIILLFRNQKFFKTNGIPAETVEILNMRPNTNRRVLELDCKRHIGNHKLDESKWTDQEFFEAHHLSTDGLTKEEIGLVRRYRQFLTWKEEDLKKTWVFHSQADFSKKRKFWKSTHINRNKLIADLDPEALEWAKNEQFLTNPKS